MGIKKKKSRKVTTAVTASVLAASMLLAGTFAWQAISQRALNESKGIVNVGGRLHDDFNGENKDIYVENFTDPLDGGTPIYARIRLDEYMEVGEDAGQKIGDPARKATPVMDGTDIQDRDSWKTYIPGAEITEPDESTPNKDIHTYWNWTMGDNESKYYMPTFNKNKDSLEADINGTYVGTDDNREEGKPYDDYVIYGTDQTEIAAGEMVDKIENEDAVYDADDDDIDQYAQGLTDEAYVTIVPETHEVKETQSGTVISMTKWVDDGKKAGNYWVYDTDGWAYWANPIMPGEATGLLLSKIDTEGNDNPGEKSYYAINVVAQFASAGDWGNPEDEEEAATGFYTDSLTPEAQDLLNTIVKAVPTVTVKNTNNVTTARVEDQIQFFADMMVGEDAITNNTITWKVVDINGNEFTDPTSAVMLADGEETEADKKGVAVTSIDATGLLTIGSDAAGQRITVIAQSAGAVGRSSLYVNSLPIIVTETNGVKTVIPKTEQTLNFSAAQVHEDGSENTELEAGEVKWSLTITDKDGAEVTTSATTIDETTGQLDIAADLEAGTMLTITGTLNANNTTYGRYHVTVLYKVPDLVTVTAADNATTLLAGSTLQFSHEATLTESITDVDQSVKWTVRGETRIHGGTSIDTNGLLTVAEAETGGNVLTIQATSTRDNTIYGEYQVEVLKVPDTVTVEPIIDGEGAGDAVFEVFAGKTQAFKATATVAGNEEGVDQNVTWSLEGGNSSGIGRSNGILSVSKTEPVGTTFTITATSKSNPKASDTYTVTVGQSKPNLITIQGASFAYEGTETIIELSAEVSLYNGTTTNVDQGVIWSLSGAKGGSTIDSSTGKLTVSANELAGTTLTITAASTSEPSVTGTHTVSIMGKETEAIISSVTDKINAVEASQKTSVVTIDGMDWYVLVNAGDKALLWSTDVVAGWGGEGSYQAAFDADKYSRADEEASLGNEWATSDARYWLNDEYLPTLPTLEAMVVETDITTRAETNADTWITTKDRMFLLSHADLQGASTTSTSGISQTTSDARDYTYGNTMLMPITMQPAASGTTKVTAYWTRSPQADTDSVLAMKNTEGSNNDHYTTTTNGLRPALWVNLGDSLKKPNYIVIQGSADYVYAGTESTIEFSAEAINNGTTENVDQGVIWSLEGATGGSTIDNSTGKLTVSANEPAGTLTITTTSTSAPSVAATYEVAIIEKGAVSSVVDEINAVEAGEDTAVVTIDGMDWYVLVNTGDRALLWARDYVAGWGGEGKYKAAFDLNRYSRIDKKASAGNEWATSDARYWLNDEYLPTLLILKSMVVETDITTREDTLADTWVTTKDKVFLLSQADLYGTSTNSLDENGTATSDPRDYTYGNAQLVTSETMRKVASKSGILLRSPRYSDVAVAVSDGSGNLVSRYIHNEGSGVRPALWVNIK